MPTSFQWTLTASLRYYIYRRNIYLLINVCIVLLDTVEDIKMRATSRDPPAALVGPVIY